MYCKGLSSQTKIPILYMAQVLSNEAILLNTVEVAINISDIPNTSVPL